MDGSAVTTLLVLGVLFVVLGVVAALDLRRARDLHAQGRPTPKTLRIALTALVVAVVAGGIAVYSVLAG